VIKNSRQLAFLALRSVHQGAFTDIALNRVLAQAELIDSDRRLVTELVYGSVRRLRSLDALIDQLAKKPAHQQPPNLRTILHLGLYQLRYLNHIPAAAAVNTTVELAKQNGFCGLTGFVNGLMRQYVRLASKLDPLHLPDNPVKHLGILHSYPDWIIAMWLEQLGFAATEQLCIWLNHPPHIDLRINPLQADLETVASKLQAAGRHTRRVFPLPQALRLEGNPGPIQYLPGFEQGWWTVQDSSAQLVSHLLDPQPGEVVIDACAAPGGKTTHIAELMADRGTIWACDRTASRLRKLQENLKRLKLQSVHLWLGDSRNLSEQIQLADHVLVDAPCSGLGTLHRHADARWRQTPETVQELSILQAELLDQAAIWVKPSGTLVYATCTLHPAENEAIVQQFLADHPDWQITPASTNAIAAPFAAREGWVKVWPQEQAMDGFFMVRLSRRHRM
jgi:16S rRNA (cytosine967-C5)-methyltransferase